MELKDIAAVSGKGGLFKVLKPSKAGVILESLDNKNQKLVAGVHHKVSILDEISIYTHTSEGSTPLVEVFKKIYKEFDDDPGVDSSASPDELKAFLKYILPDYDESKVYASDMKKVLSWYNLLHKYGVLDFTEEAEPTEETVEATTEDKEEA